jgi:type IV secretion system protein VirB6
VGFFQTFWAWLQGQLATYIGTNTTLVAEALEPAVVTLATVYVAVWGYLQLTGRIEEPLGTGVRRLVMLAVVLGGALHLWLYDSLIVDTFYRAPAQLAADIVGAPDPVATIDSIWNQGGAVAGFLWSKAGLLNGELGYYVAGAVVWVLMGLLCVYTMFLIALSSIALAILLALGPLFIALLLFDATRRFFEAWLAQLANYALITILTVLVAALLLQIVQSYAAQTAALGSALATVDSLNMVLVAVIVFLVMRQVMPIAASLAGGVSLNSFGVVSRFIAWGTRGAQASAGPYANFAARRLLALPTAAETRQPLQSAPAAAAESGEPASGSV